MKAASIDIAQILDTGFASLTFATNLFVGKEPTSPDNCVTIYDTPGREPQLTFDRSEKYFYPAIQVRVRDRAYQDGWDMINDIKEFLHGLSGQIKNSSEYTLIRCAGEPFMLEWDANNRAVFVCNFDLQRKPTT